MAWFLGSPSPGMHTVSPRSSAVREAVTTSPGSIGVMGRRAGVDAGAVEELGGDRPGTARHQARTPTQCRRAAGDDLQVHPVVAVLAGIERPVGGDPVDGNQGAVDHQVGVPGLGGVPQRRAQLRGPGGQQRHGLDDIPPGRGGADAEPGRQPPGSTAACAAACTGHRPTSGTVSPRSATTSSPASPKPSAKAGSVKLKDSRSAWPAPTTSSPRSTGAPAASPSTSASPPSRPPPQPRDRIPV